MQKEKGGIVEGIVAEKGHNILLGASMHSLYTAGRMMTLNYPLMEYVRKYSKVAKGTYEKVQ